MSITDNKPSEKKGLAAGPSMFRRWIVVGVGLGVVIVLAVVGTVWAIKDGKTSSDAMPAANAPITLPDKLGKYAAAPADTDFATQPIWLDRAKKAVPAAVVVGRSYGSAKLRRQIRVVAGRADLTGKLEFAWAADAGRTIESDLGQAHCTQNLKLVERSAAAVRPTMMLCSRITAALSAYSVIIDFDHNPTDAETMTVLDTTWKAALTGK